jgi:hypothetical protein
MHVSMNVCPWVTFAKSVGPKSDILFKSDIHLFNSKSTQNDTGNAILLQMP